MIYKYNIYQLIKFFIKKFKTYSSINKNYKNKVKTI